MCRLGTCGQAKSPGDGALAQTIELGWFRASYYSVKLLRTLSGLCTYVQYKKPSHPNSPLKSSTRFAITPSHFRDLYRHAPQFARSGVSLRGLLEDGERKSIEPMAARVPLPLELSHIKDPEQALQQFVNQSPWDEQAISSRYRRVMAPSLASPQGSSSSTTPAFPSRASTPSA